MAKSTHCGRVFPSEPELWQQQSGEMAGSLALRKVDAAAFFPPFSDYALRVGLAKVLFVDPLFALHHRDDLARLLRTWQAAHEYADRHLDEADKLIAFREKLSVPRFRQAELGLMKPGAPLPRVDDAPLRQALNQP